MELNHKILGDKQPALVIVHGLFGSLDNWMTIGKKMSEKRQVILVDQRNHGNSPHTDEHTYELMADDLIALLQEKNLTEVDLLGHSMGGKTAMKLVMKKPDLVRKLIVVDIAPKDYPVRHDGIIEALHEVPIDKLQSRQEAEEILNNRIKDFGTRQFLLKNLSRTKEGGFEWKINLPVLEKSIEKIGQGLKKPEKWGGSSLFIRGDKSDYILDEDRELLTTHFPQSKLLTIHDAGHWVHAEKPEELLKAVEFFLEN
jgi:esterase